VELVDPDLWQDARCVKCHAQIHPFDLKDHFDQCEGIVRNSLPFTSISETLYLRRFTARRMSSEANLRIPSGDPQLTLYPSPLNSSVTTIQRGETAMPGKWKKRESGGTWPPKDLKAGSKDASIEGAVVRFEENANATKENPLRDIILQTPKGEVRVWGSAILQRKVKDPEDVGKEIRITYKGKVKVKRGNAKDFEIEVKE
jgi:hypothetical protein